MHSTATLKLGSYAVQIGMCSVPTVSLLLIIIQSETNSAIHKATGRTIPSFAWYNSWKFHEAVNGEWSLRVIPTAGRTVDGGFVNSIVILDWYSADHVC